MPLFGKSHKSPADIVKTLKENLAILVKQDKKTDKVEESIWLCLCASVCEWVSRGPKGGSAKQPAPVIFWRFTVKTLSHMHTGDQRIRVTSQIQAHALFY